MEKGKSKLAPRALDKDNIRDFSFLVPEDVVNDFLSDDGTSGFAVLSGTKHSPAKYVGALCGRFITRTEYAITSIYVSEENRRQGVGTFLLETLDDILDGMDAQISIRVVRISKDAVGLIKFLEKNGFVEYFSESKRTYVIDFMNASRLNFPIPSEKLVIEPFAKIPGQTLRNFDPEKKDGFVPMPRTGFEGDNIDRDLSMAIITGDEIEGFCVVEEYLENSPVMSAFWIKESSPLNHSMSLISAVRDAALNKYDMDARLFMPVVNDKLAETVESIFSAGTLKEGVMCFKKG